MLKVVSNTTPILSLFKLSLLDILKEIYGKIIIPEAVFNEIELAKNKGYYRDLSLLDWIKVEKIKDEKAVRYFLDLDAGEAETIVLASEIGADLVIIDEKLGRFHAKHAGLKITGTAGILIKAKKIGLIQKIEPLLSELVKKGIWLSDNLIYEILKKAGERE